MTNISSAADSGGEESTARFLLKEIKVLLE
jgi:hypothetical protein